MNIPIIYEDESFIVVDKPSGIVVNKSQSSPIQTLQDWAQDKLQIKNLCAKDGVPNDSFRSRAGIVHRLDKDTSGLILIAKNDQIFILLQEQFSNKTVKKEYKTLVHGDVKIDHAEVNAPVGRLPWDRTKFGVIEQGREAKTEYDVEKRYRFKNGNYTLLKVFPYTGRTHQIRIHLKYIGHTIVSDPLYAQRNIYREDMKFCNRIFLHAHKLWIMHPKKKEKMEFISPLPQELASVIEQME